MITQAHKKFEESVQKLLSESPDVNATTAADTIDIDSADQLLDSIVLQKGNTVSEVIFTIDDEMNYNGYVDVYYLTYPKNGTEDDVKTTKTTKSFKDAVLEYNKLLQRGFVVSHKYF